MMNSKKTVFGFLFLVILLMGCETNPVIYLESQPIPVIYGIFDKSDSVHYLKIGKSFGAEYDPIGSFSVYDSLYFKEMEVEVFVNETGRPEGLHMNLEKVTEIPKDAGIFHYPGQELYRFEKSISGFIVVQVKVPNLPVASAKIQLVNLDELTTPKKGQQYVFMTPANPLRFHWHGNPWNEVDIAFEFKEHLGDSVYRSRWVHIQNTNSFDSPHERYREMKITYDEFIREVLIQLPKDESVKEVFLGYISLTILGGDANMVHYKNYYHGYSDFNVNEFSNIENGVGLVASRATFKLDSLRFDYETRQTLINENRLKVYKINPWN